MYKTLVTTFLLAHVISALPHERAHTQLVARKAPMYGDAPLNAYLRRISMDYLERIKAILQRHTPGVNAAKRSSELNESERREAVFQNHQNDLWGQELEEKYDTLLEQLNKVVRKRRQELGGLRGQKRQFRNDGTWGRELSSSNKPSGENGLWGRSLENNEEAFLLKIKRIDRH